MPKRTENVEERIAENKEKVLEALKQMPVIEVACKRSGISRATYYRWCTEDKEFRRNANSALSEGTDLINDAIESKLISKALDGNFNSMRFWLSHKHKAFKSVPFRKYEDKNSRTWESFNF